MEGETDCFENIPTNICKCNLDEEDQSNDNQKVLIVKQISEKIGS